MVAQKSLPFSTLAILSRHYLDAFSFLHIQKQVMHRDIKPSNLGIVTLNPPTGVVWDLEDGTKEKQSRDHSCGTLCYLAPEVVALKRYDEDLKNGIQSTLPTPYDRSSDVWSLGMSFNVVYMKLKPKNECITPTRYLAITEALTRKIDLIPEEEASYVAIILEMLKWDREQRPSMAEAQSNMISFRSSSAKKNKRN